MTLCQPPNYGPRPEPMLPGCRNTPTSRPLLVNTFDDTLDTHPTFSKTIVNSVLVSVPGDMATPGLLVS